MRERDEFACVPHENGLILLSCGVIGTHSGRILWVIESAQRLSGIPGHTTGGCGPGPRARHYFHQCEGITRHRISANILYQDELHDELSRE